MFPSPWRKFILPILLISQFLTLSTAVGLSQSKEVIPTRDAANVSSAINPDEPNDTMAQATPTNYGGRVGGFIGPHPDVGPDGDIDFYRFHGYDGDTLSVDADVYSFWLNAGDPHLTLRDGGGQIIAQVVGTGSPFLHLEHKLPETADYYLEMWVDCSNYNTSCEGEYAWYLGIIDPYEPNDTPQSAVPIEVGDILRGSMDNHSSDPIEEKDADYFQFQGMAGEEIVIEVSRFNDETVPDCTLQDASETILASHFGPTCRIEHTLTAAGQYTINVFSQYHEGLINHYERGPYQLTLRHKNSAPLALPDSYYGYAGQWMATAVPGVLENDTDADGDTLTAVLTTDAQHGDLVLSGDGSFTYKPEPGFIGIDTFQYHAYDGRDPSESVTATITINTQTHYLPVVLIK